MSFSVIVNVCHINAMEPAKWWDYLSYVYGFTANGFIPRQFSRGCNAAHSPSLGLEIFKPSLELYADTEVLNRHVSIYLTILSSIRSGPPCRSRFTSSTSLWCEIETDCAIPISNPRYIKIGESLTTRKTLMTELPCKPTQCLGLSPSRVSCGYLGLVSLIYDLLAPCITTSSQ